MGEVKERIIYFDFLRIISMFAVIILHTAADGWYASDIHSFEWNVFNFYDSLVRWSVPAFVMISGALFLSPEKHITVKDIFSKYIPRIVAAFAVWSLFYASLELPDGISTNDFIKKLFSGHYHMWFLPMLTGLYIIVPLLRLITEKRSATEYYLVTAFIFCIGIPTVLTLLGYIDAVHNTQLRELVQSIYRWLNFNFAVGFAFYFVLGYYLSTVGPSTSWLSQKKEFACYALGLLGFVSTIVLTRAYSFFLNRPTEAFYYAPTVNVMLQSICVFVFCRNRINMIFSQGRINRIIRELSKLSFGIYLIHPFFLRQLSNFGLNTSSFNPVLSVPVTALAVFCLSLCASAILNKIPIVNKFIV